MSLHQTERATVGDAPRVAGGVASPPHARPAGLSSTAAEGSEPAAVGERHVVNRTCDGQLAPEGIAAPIHPLAGDGNATARRHMDVSSSTNCAGEVSQPPRRLSREAFIAIAAPILAQRGTLDAVAAATGLSWDACWFRCRTYGLKRPETEARTVEVARLYRAAWAASAIAERLGVNIRTVYMHAHRARRAGIEVQRAQSDRWDARRLDYADVVRRWNAGASQREIAAVYGATQTAVSAVLRKMADSGAVTRPLGRWPKPAAPEPVVAPARPAGPPIPAGRHGGGISGYGL